MKRDGPRAPTAIHGPLGLKAKTIADCLENLFTPHDLCDENCEPGVEARVQAVLESLKVDGCRVVSLLFDKSNLCR
jgi:hypothetical protein